MTTIDHTPAIITHRKVLAIAVPVMLSNISEPLIGIVDTAVIGQLPEAHYIGAIAIGSLVFSIIYWGFGSLRMGTGGLAAQAFGASDNNELRAVLARAMIISVLIGVLLVITSPLTGWLAFYLIDASTQIENEARIYFDIRIWSAPFALANYVILGWFIGLGATGRALSVQLVLNITNMMLDALFVLGFDMTTDGVGLGTLLAEIIASLFGLVLIARRLRQTGGVFDRKAVLDRVKMLRTVAVNADIMVRSLALTFAFAFFMSRSASMGDITVGANAILMHMFEITAFFLDGFAFSAESLAGQAVGARNLLRFSRAARLSGIWGLAVAAVVAMVIYSAGGLFIDTLTVNAEIRATARQYLLWAAVTPVTGIAAFIYDGIFTGATRTADMRNMMLVSLALFLLCWWILTPLWHNHGLWAALNIFLLVRGLALWARMPALRRALFQPPARTDA